jgi:hypothetical protein
MSIKSIAILHFTELSSLALVSTLNDVIGNKLQYVDIENKKVKELFFYYIEEEIRPYIKQGLKVVIINSCKLQNNWRYHTNPYNYTYSVADEGLKISDRKISDILESFWKLLCCNSSYNTIRNEELDSEDLLTIIKEQIGSSHLVFSGNESKFIEDINTIFPKKEIPLYLVEEVGQVLCNTKLMLRK